MTKKFYRISNIDIDESIHYLQQLTFEVTGECNLKCTYCCYGDLYEGFDINRYSLSFNKVKLFIDYLSNLWENSRFTNSESDFYISFYGGEPLLNISLIKKIILYSKSKLSYWKKLHFSMTTNGVLLDRHIDFIVENDILLLVSLDGDKTGNGYRINADGISMYDKIYNNLKQIKDTYPIFFKDRIQFNTVLHQKNSINHIECYFDKEFEKKTNITELSQDDLKESHKNTFYKEMYKSYIEDKKNDSTDSEIDYFIKRHTGNYFDSYNSLLQNQEENTIFQTATCIPFSKKIFITASGKILPCERISHHYKLGEITENKVNFDFNFIVNKYNKLLDSLLPICTKCYNKNTCRECLYKTLNTFTKKKYCPSFLDKEKYIEYYNSNISKLNSNPELYLNHLK